MWFLSLLPLFLASRVAHAADFKITRFNAAASPILVSGKTRSFVEFFVQLTTNTLPPARCYNWAETHDATIQGTTTTECDGNPKITWSFEPSSTSGFDLNIYWSFGPSSGLFGSHWVKPDELDWASSEGIDVQVYNGPSDFVIKELSNSTRRA